MTRPSDISPNTWDEADSLIVALEEYVDFSNDGRITAVNMGQQYLSVQMLIARTIQDAIMQERLESIAAIQKLHEAAWGITEEQSALEDALHAIRERGLSLPKPLINKDERE